MFTLAGEDALQEQVGRSDWQTIIVTLAAIGLPVVCAICRLFWQRSLVVYTLEQIGLTDRGRLRLRFTVDSRTSDEIVIAYFSVDLPLKTIVGHHDYHANDLFADSHDHGSGSARCHGEVKSNDKRGWAFALSRDGELR